MLIIAIIIKKKRSSGSNIIKKETKCTICGFFTFRKLHNVLLQKMPSPYRHLMQQMFCMLEARHRRTDNRNVLWESNFYRPQTDHNCAFAICECAYIHWSQQNNYIKKIFILHQMYKFVQNYFISSQKMYLKVLQQLRIDKCKHRRTFVRHCTMFTK